MTPGRPPVIFRLSASSRMSNADTSYTGRLARLRSRTQAIFRVRNPDIREFGPGGDATPESVRQGRALGQITVTLESPAGTLTTVPPCCPTTCEPVCPVLTDAEDIPLFAPFDLSDNDIFSGFTKGEIEAELLNLYGTPITITPPAGYTFDMALFVTYPPYCNATSYSVALTVDGSPVTFQSIQYGPSTTQNIAGAIVIFPDIDILIDDVDPPFLGGNGLVSVTVTASNSCSSSSGEAQFFCFLAGSPVAMADGTTKSIESVTVGDRVIGAFGEINTVTGTLSNSLGLVSITNINGEHKTTAPHPHITVDHKLSCTDTFTLTKFAYGRSFPLKGADGTIESRVIKGVSRERIEKLKVGTVLQTLTGARTVTTLETIRMPPSTRVYHLTTDGSHSYTVDGYAVAGGATEEDFNYDTWTPRA
jgi:hypothetical protein